MPEGSETEDTPADEPPTDRTQKNVESDQGSSGVLGMSARDPPGEDTPLPKTDVPSLATITSGRCSLSRRGLGLEGYTPS